jgi:hypothetical protein
MTEKYGKEASFGQKFFDEVGVHSPIARGLREVPRVMGRLFNEGDLVFKRAVMPRMVAQYDHYLKQLGPSDLELVNRVYGTTDPVVLVHRMVTDQLQSYNKIPEFWQKVAHQGQFVGMFATFAAEMTRNMGRSFDYMGKELRVAALAEDPKLKQFMAMNAVRRGLGMTAALYFTDSMKEMWDAKNGGVLSDRQEEVFAKRGVPSWDVGGKIVVHEKRYNAETGDLEIVYTPLSRTEYFDKLRDMVSYGTSLASSMARGDFEAVPKQALDLLLEASSVYFPVQEPFGTLVESIGNIQLTDDSIFKTALDWRRGVRPKPLIIDPREGERSKVSWEHLRKGLTPTLIKQASSLLGGSKTFRQVFPVGQERSSNVLWKMKSEGAVLSQVKNTYAARLNALARDTSKTDKEKRSEVYSLQQDWERDTGREIRDTIIDWDDLYPDREHVYRELGQKLGKSLVGQVLEEGRVPDFYVVFSDSIPQDIGF